MSPAAGIAGSNRISKIVSRSGLFDSFCGRRKVIIPSPRSLALPSQESLSSNVFNDKLVSILSSVILHHRNNALQQYLKISSRAWEERCREPFHTSKSHSPCLILFWFKQKITHHAFADSDYQWGPTACPDRCRLSDRRHGARPKQYPPAAGSSTSAGTSCISTAPARAVPR